MEEDGGRDGLGSGGMEEDFGQAQAYAKGGGEEERVDLGGSAGLGRLVIPRSPKIRVICSCKVDSGLNYSKHHSTGA